MHVPVRTFRVRAWLAIGFALVLCAVAVAPAGASPAGGNRIWLGRVAKAGYPYGGEAVSPDGTTVVVTGESGTTAAYNAATGTKLWIATTGQGTVDTLEDVAISPDSSRAYVVGYSYTNPQDSLLVASYDITTGAQLWLVKTGGAIGRRVAVSPDGSTVYVTGTSTGIDTIAYAADTGTQLWETLYTVGLENSAIDLALSNDGSTLFVVGASIQQSYNDFVTVAYDAAAGSELWATRYNSGGTRGDTPAAIAVSPDGSKVFVTGCTGDFDYCVNGYMVTIAYDAVTGDQLWIALHQGAGHGDDSATDLTVSRDGSLVYVVGSSESKQSYDYAVVSYAAATGSVMWTSAYRGAGNENDYPCCVALSPDGTRLYVTGDTGVNWATVSFDAATGKQEWAAVYDGPAHGTDLAFGVGVSPDGTQVYVTGSSLKVGYDFTTIDYGA